MRHLRKRLTYANVMSSIAVFLVLGGATAFAATKIGANQIKANSIKTGKIVKEAVTAGKIKGGAVTESRIANGAVTTAKLAAGAVTEANLANEAVGNAKIKNGAVNGAKLADGSIGLAKLASGILSPTCPSGTNGFVGHCLETTERPASGYVAAVETCTAAGRELPRASVLIGFAKKVQPLPAQEWSGDLFSAATAFSVKTDGTPKEEPFAAVLAFRCVAEPTP